MIQNTPHTPSPPGWATAGLGAVKAIAVVNRATGERLTVELEIGQSLWLLNDQGAVEKVERVQLPVERWQILGVDPSHCWDGGGALHQVAQESPALSAHCHNSIKCEVDRVPVLRKA